MNKSLKILAILLLFIGLGTGFLIAKEFQKTTKVRSKFYPQMPNTLNFDHQKHISTPCITCHEAATTSQRSADNLMPTMKTCTNCHTEKESSPAPKSFECSTCHLGYKKNSKPGADYRQLRPQPMFIPRAQSKLIFDHAKHIKTQVIARVQKLPLNRSPVKENPSRKNMLCESCHEMNENIFPSEEKCITCHAQEGNIFPALQHEKNGKACQTCHITTDKTRRLDTQLNPMQTLQPNNHEVDWIKRHGAISRTEPDNCASCHLENDCAQCHNEKVAKPFAVHPPNFLTIHSLNARANMGACSDCHNSQSFCFECHSDAKLTMRSGKSPPSKTRFHPEGWLDASTVFNHGVAARRDITECASCHQERDCIACHDGINPHPADFVFTCREWLAANSEPCAKCHQDMTLLFTMCR